MSENNFVLFDPPQIKNLYPLALTRSVADFRVGVFTIRKKWAIHLKQEPLILTREYLQELYPFEVATGVQIFINGSIIPNEDLVCEILKLEENSVLKSKDHIIAIKTTEVFSSSSFLLQQIEEFNNVIYNGSFLAIKNNWDVFQLNGEQIKQDVALANLKHNPERPDLSKALSISNRENIIGCEGIEIGACILNADEGPIVIGKHAKILDGAIVKGPVSIGSNAVIKMGAKIYGETTIGPHCKAGGEVSNCVLFGYSNKGHDGYLGNSVLGEWCNLGADTNTSNLKNNYSFIKKWSYESEGYEDSGLQFCGLIMGDHAKSGINTMFNTGTVVGVAANVFGAGFPPKFIPSFSWGGSDGFEEFKINKAFVMAENMMKRRSLKFTPKHRAIFEYIFEQSSKYRNR